MNEEKQRQNIDVEGTPLGRSSNLIADSMGTEDSIAEVLLNQVKKCLIKKLMEMET